MAHLEYNRETHSPEETLQLARRLGKRLFPGSVVCLIGPLGSGKTLFVQGLTKGLGTSQQATSPSFKLLNCYSGGKLPVYHFDFYRLAESGLKKELLGLGYQEYFYGNGMSVIEWAEKIISFLPEEHLEIYFQYLGLKKRKIKFVPCGEKYRFLITQIFKR